MTTKNEERPLSEGYHRVGVYLPPSIVAIIEAAGGAQDFPRATASIIGALPWIAVQLSESLSADDYKKFMVMMKSQIQGAWDIMAAKNVRKAFDEAFEAAKKEIN